MWQCFKNGKKMEFLCSAAHCYSLPLHPVLTQIKLTAKKNEIEISRLKHSAQIFILQASGVGSLPSLSIFRRLQ
jgi:hypothetical protein